MTSAPIEPYCTARDPFRPPDWRFRRAEKLDREGLAPSPRRDDAVVHENYRYLAWRRLDEELPGRRFPPEMAPVRRAVAIYEGIWSGIRWFAEAAALADMGPDQIAPRIGVAREVEWVFEQSCFDVRDRLDYPMLILHTCIRVDRIFQGEWLWPDIGWKVLAYVHGPGVLDRLSPAWGISRSQPWRGVDNIPGDAADVAVVAAALRTVLGDFHAEQFRKALDLQGRLEKVATGLENWPRSEQQAKPWRWTPAASQAGVGQAEVPVSEQMERDTRDLLDAIRMPSRSRR